MLSVKNILYCKFINIRKEDNVTYKYTALDGRAIKYMTVQFMFRKNQDSMFILTNMIFQEKDKITIEAEINPPNNFSTVIMFCREKETALAQRFKDIVIY